MAVTIVINNNLKAFFKGNRIEKSRKTSFLESIFSKTKTEAMQPYTTLHIATDVI